VVEECAQPIEDYATALQDFLNVDTASGEWLDIIGKMVGVKRNDGESDDDFRKRVIVFSMENDAGTPNNVIDVAKELSGDPAPQYLDEVPATFFVYTPNGKALTLSQVDKLAPAGVLGLPGAAIRLGNGGFLQNAGGKKFLSVIPNAEWKLEALLIESSGLHIVTDSGKRIRIVAEQSRRANA
jgi:hypothetical protein